MNKDLDRITHLTKLIKAPHLLLSLADINLVNFKVTDGQIFLKVATG